MTAPIRVTVWGENLHEHRSDVVGGIYPDGMHETIADAIRGHLGEAAVVRTATLDQPEHGLTTDVVDDTDVMTWWGHMAHHQVDDAIADRVHQAVLAGMGLVVLHSGHLSKPFVRLMGTTCHLLWREAGEREAVWTVNPGHPVAIGVPPVFTIPQQEMYGEYFDIPQPDELVFISSFPGGEVFRSGCAFTRGAGRVFYFSPGHETYPVYHQPEVQRVVSNAVRWCYTDRHDREPRRTSRNAPMGWFEAGEPGAGA